MEQQASSPWIRSMLDWGRTSRRMGGHGENKGTRSRRKWQRRNGSLGRKGPLSILWVRYKNCLEHSWKLCPTLCNPMDCSLPGSSIHGIFQARILEWIAISFSRRCFWPRDWTRVSHIVGRRFTVWDTREELYLRLRYRKYNISKKELVFWLVTPKIFICMHIIYNESSIDIILDLI